MVLAGLIVFLKPVQLPSLSQLVHGTTTTTSTTAPPGRSGRRRVHRRHLTATTRRHRCRHTATTVPRRRTGPRGHALLPALPRR